jgi:hypothetical protein
VGVPDRRSRRTVPRVQVEDRVRRYLLFRGGAAVVFLLASVALPRGVPSAMAVMGAGLVAVFACLGINAGGPGEQAGAVPQERWLEGVRPPQGDWPPFDPDRVVDGELVERPD